MKFIDKHLLAVLLVVTALVAVELIVFLVVFAWVGRPSLDHQPPQLKEAASVGGLLSIRASLGWWNWAFADLRQNQSVKSLNRKGVFAQENP
jgi:hypothetical protein